MGRVCLILPLGSAADLSNDQVERYRRGLEASGHSVEIRVVLDPTGPLPGGRGWMAGGSPGLCSAAMTGLAGAEADCLVILDPSRDYGPDDLARVVAASAEGKADLVVGRRDRADLPPWWPRGPASLSSGLVAMTPEVAAAVSGSFRPVGSRFALELIFRSGGSRALVPVRGGRRGGRSPLDLDDFRQLKRLADDRFGNASRLIQFCAVGSSGMVMDLGTYAASQSLLARTWMAGRVVPGLGVSLDLAVAALLAIGLALTWNFSLNRRLTFSYAREGSIVRQFLVYALSNGLGILLSLSLRLALPARIGFFRRHKLAAAVIGIVMATGFSFTMSRWLVFGRRPGHRPSPARPEATAARRLHAGTDAHPGPGSMRPPL